jgi:hypothetical protein
MIDSIPGAADVISGIIQNLSSVVEEAEWKLAAFKG